MITFVVVGSNSLYFKILFFILVFVFQSQSFGLCLRHRFTKCLYQSKNPFALNCKGILIFFSLRNQMPTKSPAAFFVGRSDFPIK